MSQVVWGTPLPDSRRGGRRNKPSGWGSIIATVALAIACAVVFRVIEHRDETEELSVTTGATSSDYANTLLGISPASDPEQTTQIPEQSPPSVIAADPTDVGFWVALDRTEDVSVTAVASSETPTSIPHADIHSADFASLPVIERALGSVGGRLDATTVRFADLTGDGTDEALVPISSGGTIGDVAYFVVAVANGQPAVLFGFGMDPSVRNASRVFIEEGQLVEARPLYQPSDPLCCPSAIESARYAWNGETFTVQAQEVIQRSSAK